MTDRPPMIVHRKNGHRLSVVKHGARYDISINGGGNLTPDELQQVADYIGIDPDGQSTLEKLRAR